MKLKKILAVALAATTALSSGVAYDLLGGANEAQASDKGFYSVGETFTVEYNNLYEGATQKTGDAYKVKFTYEVTKPILNGQLKDAAGSGDKNIATNGTYSNGKVKTTADYSFPEQNINGIGLTTEGLVKLKSIELPSDLSGNAYTVRIPYQIQGHSNTTGVNGYIVNMKNDGENISVTSDLKTDGNLKTDGLAQDGKFYMNEIDLDGSSISNADKIVGLAIATGSATSITSLKADNFSKLTNIGYDSETTPVFFDNAEKIDVSETSFRLDKVQTLFNGSTKLKNLDIHSLDSTVNDVFKAETARVAFDFESFAGKVESVDISGNANIGNVTYKDNNGGSTLNISDCSGIQNFTVTGPNTSPNGLTFGGNNYDNPTAKGIRFITDGSNATYDLDMSFVSNAKDIRIVNAGIRTFVAPNMTDTKHVLDLHKNSLTSVNLSASSNAKEVVLDDNKLMDLDTSGLANCGDLSVQRNYLTSLDVSSVNGGKSFVLHGEKNFIPTGDNGNFTKSDDQKAMSLSEQRAAEAFKWAYVGDIGQASGTESKAIMKLGGTGTIVGGIVVVGAPDGFAQKLADTVKWTEGNTNDNSAIALGETATVQAVETGYNLNFAGQGNLSAVLVSAGLTANATKTAAEKLTLQYGNTKKDINISNDNVIFVDYDITSALPTDDAENIKTKNNFTVSFAQLLFPREAFILGNNGTVDALMSAKAYPRNKVDDTVANKPLSGDWTEALEQKLRVMEGVTFTKWNTAADGTGTAAAKNSKMKALEADTTVYAQYTENTYGINFNKESGGHKRPTVTGSTASQTGVKFGEAITLNSNGYTTTEGNFYGWKVADGSTFYSDGESVMGLTAKDKKSDNYKLEALYGEANHYITAGVSSIDLVVGDADKGAYKLGDVKAVVNGDPTYTNERDGQLSIDLGYDNNVKKFQYLSSNQDIVQIVTDGTNYQYALAKGAGTANIYVRDRDYGNVATIAVTVQSKDEAAAAVELKAKQAAANKAIAAGEKTDVADFSKFAAEIVKNADGEDTVTITKGKNVATAKINTILIGDKTYTVTRIGANAYKGKSKLKTVTTSNNVKVIGKAAFANCKKLTKVTLGKKVAKIAANAFKGDKKLAKIMIKSKKLTSKAKVGKNSFKGIKATAKFYIAKKAKTYKKVKKAIKAQSGAPKKATYVGKYA